MDTPLTKPCDNTEHLCLILCYKTSQVGDWVWSACACNHFYQLQWAVHVQQVKVVVVVVGESIRSLPPWVGRYSRVTTLHTALHATIADAAFSAGWFYIRDFHLNSTCTKPKKKKIHLKWIYRLIQHGQGFCHSCRVLELRYLPNISLRMFTDM
jgi:hypothetical protein